MQQVTIYEWPQSQLCAECDNSEFVQSEKFNNSNYICLLNHIYNNGIFCNGLNNHITKYIDKIISTEYNMLKRLYDYDNS